MRVRAVVRFAGILLAAHFAGAQPAVRQLRLTEVLRIDGAKEDISGAPAHLWVGADGRIAVFNSPTASFVFFDSTGKRLGTFGGRGQGPGEFQLNAARMISLRLGALRDTLWAYASNVRRFTLVTPDLKLARVFSLPQYNAPAIGTFEPLALLSNNRVLGRALGPSDTTIAVMGPDGSIVQRIAVAPFNTSMARVSRGEGRNTFVPIPFAVAPIIVPSFNGDRFAVVSYRVTSQTGGTFQLTVIRTTGDTVFSRTLPYTGAPVSKALADSTLALRARSFGESGADLVNAIRERMPTSMAPFGNAELGSDGTIWLRRYAWGIVPGQFMILSATGDLIGEAKFPRAGMTLWAATRTTAWATETDGDGFVSIVRYRVESP